MDGRQVQILVADDDADIRSIVCSAISILGFHPLEAADGQEAFNVARQNKIDLAILDYMMPGMNGLEVCQSIKNLEGGNYIPVILLTARDTLRDKLSAFQQGADDYLTKPFHYEELQARVKAQLRVRELNLHLLSKNNELKAAQEKLVQQERQLLAVQLGGTAAHSLGQPLSAIMLNCHLLEKLPTSDQRYMQALSAIKSDSRKMAELLEKLKAVDAAKTESYYGTTEILDVDSSDKSQS